MISCDPCKCNYINSSLYEKSLSIQSSYNRIWKKCPGVFFIYHPNNILRKLLQ